MTTIVKQEGRSKARLFDFLESQLPSLPMFLPTFTPALRVEERMEEGAYLLRLEAPGIDPEKDVEITVEAGLLTVVVTRKEEMEEAERSEFHYGRLTRSVVLPTGADDADVRATYRDGILEVRVGITARQEPLRKHIAVSRS